MCYTHKKDHPIWIVHNSWYSLKIYAYSHVWNECKQSINRLNSEATSENLEKKRAFLYTNTLLNRITQRHTYIHPNYTLRMTIDCLIEYNYFFFLFLLVRPFHPFCLFSYFLLFPRYNISIASECSKQTFKLSNTWTSVHVVSGTHTHTLTHIHSHLCM